MSAPSDVARSGTRSAPPSTSDVLIIGAGPAGACSAALLARRGFDVTVVERERFPRFVIGESLLPRCMDILDEAGLLPAVEARGFQIKRGAAFLRGNEITRFSFSEQFTAGWSYTYQVPRDDFDKTLADGAAAMGANIYYEHAVEHASFDDEPRVDVIGPNGHRTTVRPRFVIDASGYGRVLPRLLALDRPSGFPPRAALFTHVTGDKRASQDDAARIWICVHPLGGWLWIIPFSDGRTSVGAVGAPDFFDAFPPNPTERLRAIIASEPNAARRVSAAEFIFEPRSIVGYAAAVERYHGEGFCLVGNATDFLDPIFSSGVTLALESASRACGLIARQLRGEVVDWDGEYVGHMQQGFKMFRSYVESWYDGTLGSILFAPEPDPGIRAQICSVFAGYVWDKSNVFAREPNRKLKQVARLVVGSHKPA